MARAGNTKKKSKFVVRKAASAAAGKKPSAKSRSARPSRKKSVRKPAYRKPVKKVKPLLRVPVRSKTAGKTSVKSGKKKRPVKTSAQKAAPSKKNFSAKSSAVKKAQKKQTMSKVKPSVVKPSVKKVQKPVFKSRRAIPAAAEKKNVRRVKATDRSPGLAKKELEIPFGGLRVGIVKKPVYSKIAEAEKRKPAAARRVTAAKMAVKKKVPDRAPEPALEPAPARDYPQELPSNYGDNLIYLMVRDPHWIYAYWELQRDYVEGSRESLGGTWDEVCTVLRVYDVTENHNNPVYQDLYLGGITDHWHINAVPDRSYFVEIGLLHKDGRFLALARSNPVVMPRDSMSDVLDEEWMDIDFDKVYALSGGFDVGKSSQELRKLMQDRMQGHLSSGSGSGVGIVTSMSSPGSGSWSSAPETLKSRKFFFWLDCEVIVYGGTEPDAKVTFQGKVIKLRPDGTFSFRFALPDGKFVFDAKAESSDGVEERVITPVVQRETSRPAPVFKKGKA